MVGRGWGCGGWGMCDCWGACMVAGGVCVVTWAHVVARGHAWLPGGMCGSRGHAWLQSWCVWLLGGVHGCGGACMGHNKIRSMSREYISYWNAFLCFYKHLSVNGVGLSASVHAGIPPLGADPPQEQTPHQSRHPPGADTPRSRHPHRADTPQEQKPLPQRRHSPQEQTPLSRHPLPGADTPWDQTPPWEQTPPWNRHPPGVDTDDNFVKRNTKLSAVVDPGFLRGDANPKMGCQPIIWSKFVENCMDIKKIGLGCPWCPSDPPLVSSVGNIVTVFYPDRHHPNG